MAIQTKLPQQAVRTVRKTLQAGGGMPAWSQPQFVRRMLLSKLNRPGFFVNTLKLSPLRMPGGWSFTGTARYLPFFPPINGRPNGGELLRFAGNFDAIKQVVSTYREVVIGLVK